MASRVPAGNGCPFDSCSMVNEPTSGTKPAIATRIVFAEEEARAGLAGAMTGDERLGGTEARGGPLGDEASRGRLAGGTETGASRAGGGGRDNMGTGGRVDLHAGGGNDLRGGGGKSDDVRAGGRKDDTPAWSGGGQGGSFAGGGLAEPRSRTSDRGGDGAEASRGLGALRFVNCAIA